MKRVENDDIVYGGGESGDYISNSIEDIEKTKQVVKKFKPPPISIAELEEAGMCSHKWDKYATTTDNENVMVCLKCDEFEMEKNLK